MHAFDKGGNGVIGDLAERGAEYAFDLVVDLVEYTRPMLCDGQGERAAVIGALDAFNEALALHLLAYDGEIGALNTDAVADLGDVLGGVLMELDQHIHLLYRDARLAAKRGQLGMRDAGHVTTGQQELAANLGVLLGGHRVLLGGVLVRLVALWARRADFPLAFGDRIDGFAFWAGEITGGLAVFELLVLQLHPSCRSCDLCRERFVLAAARGNVFRVAAEKGIYQRNEGQGVDDSVVKEKRDDDHDDCETETPARHRVHTVASVHAVGDVVT